MPVTLIYGSIVHSIWDYLFGNTTFASVCLTSYVLLTFLKFKNRTYWQVSLSAPSHSVSRCCVLLLCLGINILLPVSRVPFLPHLIYVISAFGGKGLDCKGRATWLPCRIQVCLWYNSASSPFPETKVHRSEPHEPPLESFRPLEPTGRLEKLCLPVA